VLLDTVYVGPCFVTPSGKSPQFLHFMSGARLQAMHMPLWVSYVNVTGGFNKFMARAYDLPQGETVLSTFGEPFGMQIHTCAQRPLCFC
jgi:hypothetical protein